MKHEDVEIIESFLTKIVGDAKQALEILEARRRRGEYGPRSESVLPDLIDDGRFTVCWNGDECHLGWSVLFRLFRRLARPANHYVSVERLLEDVWQDRRTDDTTVRSAVRNLRRKLREAGMAELAAAIQGEPGYYRLWLDGVAPTDGRHGEGTETAPPVHGPRS